MEIDEAQRQAILLALAKLSLSRPGWHTGCLLPIAETLNGKAMYLEFRGRGPDLPAVNLSDLDAGELNERMESLRLDVIGQTEGEQLKFIEAILDAGQSVPFPPAKVAAHIVAIAAGSGPESLARLIAQLQPFLEGEWQAHANKR